MYTPHIISPLLAILTLLIVVVVIKLLGLPRFTDSKVGHLASIDGIRGLLAIFVVFHHFYESYTYQVTGTWGSQSSPIYSLFGTAAVTIFFMITGFLFLGKIRAVRGNVDFNRFFVGRIFRIVPVYIVSVILIYFTTFCMTGFHVDRNLQVGLDQWVLFHAAVINDYANSTFIGAGVFWTLRYEWIFYFSIPVISFLWSRLQLQSWVVGLAAITCLYFHSASVPFVGIDCGQLAPFVLGGLVGEVGRVAALRRFAVGRWGAILSIVTMTIIFSVFSTAYSVSGNVLLFIFFLPIALGNSVFGFLRLPAVRFLGEISFDIYLLHGIVIFILFTVLMPNTLSGIQTSWGMLAAMLITTFAVIALSLVVHLLVERPMLRFGRSVVLIDNVQTLAAP